MSSSLKELFDFDMVTPETANVYELISALRLSFRRANFDKVAEVLVARDKRMKKEIEQGKREYALLEKKHADAVLACLVAEAKIDELNSAKVKAERELEIVKMENGALDLRVARIEDCFEDFFDTWMRQGQVEPRVVEKAGSIDANGGPLGTGSGNSFAHAAAADSSPFKGFGIRPCDEGDSSQRDNHHKTNSTVAKNKAAIIVISDSEDDMPAQNKTLNVPTVAMADVSLTLKEIKSSTSEEPDGRNQCTSSMKRKRENNNGFLSSDSSSSDSDSSDSDSDASSSGSDKAWGSIKNN